MDVLKGKIEANLIHHGIQFVAGYKHEFASKKTKITLEKMTSMSKQIPVYIGSTLHSSGCFLQYTRIVLLKFLNFFLTRPWIRVASNVLHMLVKLKIIHCIIQICGATDVISHASYTR
jgi:hypothetical protein